MGNVANRDKTTVPHFVGRYEVLVPIASGGMATVYLARSRGAGGFERDVALKLTHMHLRESPEFQSLLIEEAKLASSIRHHNVVSVLDVGDDPLGLFLVMDYVEGDTFSGLLRRGRAANEPMPQRVAMHVLLDALAGLHAAHETHDSEGKPLHIVHRDFSPQNILVGTDGISKLTDFGIAKAASRVGHTSTGVLKGKIAYMSPEQARGLPLDRRADVWAAGVLAWEIVVGRSLWPREAEDVSTLIKLVTEPPPRLKAMDPTISDALDEAVGKALATDVAERWPTAAAFAKAIIGAVERADADEVASYVRTSAGPKIEQRREQIRAMGTLRAKIGEITEASEHTPSGNQVRASPTQVEVAPDHQAREEQVDNDATEVVSGIALPSAPAVLESAASADSATNGVRGPPRWAIPLVAGVTGLGLIVLLIAAVSRHGDGSKAPPTQTSAMSVTAPTPSIMTPDTSAAGTETAAPTMTATPIVMTTATAIPTATATPTATVPPTVMTTTATTRATATAGSHSPRPPPPTSKLLAPSPY